MCPCLSLTLGLTASPGIQGMGTQFLKGKGVMLLDREEWESVWGRQKPQLPPPATSGF